MKKFIIYFTIVLIVGLAVWFRLSNGEEKQDKKTSKDIVHEKTFAKVNTEIDEKFSAFGEVESVKSSVLL